jgi:hypothetical protein
MSNTTTCRLKCQQCKTEHEYNLHESVNVTREPELREQLFSGELTRFKCPACGWTGQIWYPLLYHDMQRLFMIWQWPPNSLPEPVEALRGEAMAGYRLRLVVNRNELLEKILIFEDHYDDRVMEVVKLALAVQAAKGSGRLIGDWFYAGTIPAEGGSGEMLKFEVLEEDTIYQTSAPRSLYDQLGAALSDKMPPEKQGEWVRINADYAYSVAKACT